MQFEKHVHDYFNPVYFCKDDHKTVYERIEIRLFWFQKFGIPTSYFPLTKWDHTVSNFYKDLKKINLLDMVKTKQNVLFLLFISGELFRSSKYHWKYLEYINKSISTYVSLFKLHSNHDLKPYEYDTESMDVNDDEVQWLHDSTLLKDVKEKFFEYDKKFSNLKKYMKDRNEDPKHRVQNRINYFIEGLGFQYDEFRNTCFEFTLENIWTDFKEIKFENHEYESILKMLFLMGELFINDKKKLQTIVDKLDKISQ